MKRGPKSAADMAVVIGGRFGARPAPPDELDEAEAAIWQKTVDSEAVDCFGTAALRMLLADFCRHRTAADRLSAMVAGFHADWLKDEEGAKRYDLLLRMRERETRASVTVATKLRLTNQSKFRSVRPGEPAPAAKALRPWEV